MDIIQKIATVASPFLLIYIAYVQNRSNQLQAQLNDKKRVTYEKFIDLLVDALLDSKPQNTINSSDFKKRMYDFKKNFILFASPRSIKAFNVWTKNSSANRTDLIFEDVENLIRSLREEIGLSNLTLAKYDVIQLLVKENLSEIVNSTNKGK